MPVSWRAKTFLGAAVVASTVLSSATPASAAWPDDYFYAETSQPNTGVNYGGYTTGTIAWGNRTASVSGKVVDYLSSGTYDDGFYTTAIFEAFAGTTKVDTQTRTAGISLPHEVGFAFSIGDPNRVGGIDRVRVQICDSWNGTFSSCSAQWNYLRDSVSQNY